MSREALTAPKKTIYHRKLISMNEVSFFRPLRPFALVDLHKMLVDFEGEVH